MRFQIGNLTAVDPSPPEGEGWTRLVSPSSPTAHLLAWLIGIATLVALLAVVITSSLITLPATFPPSDAEGATPWLAVVLTLLLSVPAHELVHAVFYPDHGLSPATLLVVWPGKLLVGVSYEGHISRSRWLMMRLAPFALLSVVPTILLAATSRVPRSFAAETSLSLLLLVNSLGSGGDILAAAWVFLKVPRGSALAFKAGYAYWRPPGHTHGSRSGQRPQ
jgi:hypothetical protein